jgi:hypothetical protein
MLRQKHSSVLWVTSRSDGREEGGLNKRLWELVMNHSIYNADRSTHLKIVAVGLLCASLVVAIGMFAHVSDIDLGTAPLVKAGQSTTLSGQLPAIR